MKHANNSIFTRVLALVLCLVTVAGLMTACFRDIELNEGIGSTSGESTTKPGVTTTKPSTTTKPTTGTTTGDVAGNDPIEDPVDPDEIYSASTSLAEDALIFGTLASDVVIGGEDGVGAILPADVKVAEGTSALSLSVKKAETGSEINLGEGDVAHSLDIHIDGIAADNTVPMIVNLGAVLAIGLENTELKLYHIEGGVAVLMTRVDSIDEFAIHNQYTYNAETGEVSIYVASFSVFSAVSTAADKWDGETVAEQFSTGSGTENDPYIINSAAEFVFFRDMVDSGYTFAGEYVSLGTDIDLDNINFDPIGFGYVHQGGQAFMGTFDGANHTIYNLYQNGWDLDPDKTNYSTYTYSTAGGGLFASIKDATIKNLAVSGANIVFECVDIGIVVGYAQGTCHFENIVVTNSKIANYQRATGGVVGEVCFGPYGTDIEQGYSHTFKNITVDSSVTVGSLWGDFDNISGGVIGGKWGDATVKMENVTSAVKLDVYSDVTSAYQWYAYRRCGMLIGHTEQNSPKSALNADAPFLTCENVKVYYGDWVNYTYCQFAHSNNPGYRYPWVRVQVGLNNGAYSNPRYGNPTDFAGNKVTDDNHTHAEGEGHHVLIKFDQLYGGGQGVYGKADHDGVTIFEKNTKTIYFQNNWNWTNLKLHYWFENGEDRWTTVVDGISVNNMVSEKVGGYDVYTFEMPAYVAGFKVEGYDGTALKTHSTDEVSAENIIEGNVYWFVFSNNAYAIASNKYEPDFETHNIYVIGDMNNWATENIDSQYNLIPSADGKTWTISITFDVTTQIKMFNSLVVSEGYGGWINGKDTTDNVELAPGKYTLTYTVADNSFTFTMTERKIYLKPTGWESGARFAVYVWNGNGNKWIGMTKESDGTYSCFVPVSYSNIIFGRMNNSQSANNWNNCWNQSGDETIPSNGNNLWTVTTPYGNDNKSYGSWSRKAD